jgi:hypothetical protein
MTDADPGLDPDPAQVCGFQDANKKISFFAFYLLVGTFTTVPKKDN